MILHPVYSVEQAPPGVPVHMEERSMKRVCSLLTSHRAQQHLNKVRTSDEMTSLLTKYYGNWDPHTVPAREIDINQVTAETSVKL